MNTQTPINWNSPNAATFTQFYRSLLALRKDNPALQQGAVGWLASSQSTRVASYTRSSPSGTLLVLISFSAGTVTGTVTGVPAAAGWTDLSPVGSPGGRTHVAPPNFSLAPFDFAVFRAAGI